MNSTYIDSLKLALSDKYEISDNQYERLSDILINGNLSESVLDSGLIPLIEYLVRSQYNFPMTFYTLKVLWSKYIGDDFELVSFITPMIKEGLINFKRVKRIDLDKKGVLNLYENPHMNKLEEDSLITVFGTEKFGRLLVVFKNILKNCYMKQPLYTEDEEMNTINSDIDVQNGGIMTLTNEGFVMDIILPANLKKALKRISQLMRENFGIIMSEESYIRDDLKKEEELNLTFKLDNSLKMSDNDISKLARRTIQKGNKGVISATAYKDSPKVIFVNLLLNTKNKSSYEDIPNGVYKFFQSIKETVEAEEKHQQKLAITGGY